MTTLAELGTMISRTRAAMDAASSSDRPWLAAQAEDMIAEWERRTAPDWRAEDWGAGEPSGSAGKHA